MIKHFIVPESAFDGSEIESNVLKMRFQTRASKCFSLSPAGGDFSAVSFYHKPFLPSQKFSLNFRRDMHRRHVKALCLPSPPGGRFMFYEDVAGTQFSCKKG